MDFLIGNGTSGLHFAIRNIRSRYLTILSRVSVKMRYKMSQEILSSGFQQMHVDVSVSFKIVHLR